jgi:hypothetical protein
LTWYAPGHRLKTMVGELNELLALHRHAPSSADGEGGDIG